MIETLRDLPDLFECGGRNWKLIFYEFLIYFEQDRGRRLFIRVILN